MKIFLFIIFGVVVVIVVNWLIMVLWNMLMPDVFGLPTLTYWQTLGLAILIKMLSHVPVTTSSKVK